MFLRVLLITSFVGLLPFSVQAQSEDPSAGISSKTKVDYFEIKHGVASEVAETLKPLFDSATFAPNDATNVLFVRYWMEDEYREIHEMVAMIESVAEKNRASSMEAVSVESVLRNDASTKPELQLQVFSLKHISAEEAQETLFKLNLDNNRGISTSPNGNSLIVRGDENDMLPIAELIESIDVPAQINAVNVGAQQNTIPKTSANYQQQGNSTMGLIPSSSGLLNNQRQNVASARNIPLGMPATSGLQLRLAKKPNATAEEIEEWVSEAFWKRLREQAKQLEVQKNRILTIQDRLAANEKNADKIIEQRVKSLLKQRDARIRRDDALFNFLPGVNGALSRASEGVAKSANRLTAPLSATSASEKLENDVLLPLKIRERVLQESVGDGHPSLLPVRVEIDMVTKQIEKLNASKDGTATGEAITEVTASNLKNVDGLTGKVNTAKHNQEE